MAWHHGLLVRVRGVQRRDDRLFDFGAGEPVGRAASAFISGSGSETTLLAMDARIFPRPPASAGRRRRSRRSVPCAPAPAAGGDVVRGRHEEHAARFSASHVRNRPRTRRDVPPSRRRGQRLLDLVDPQHARRQRLGGAALAQVLFGFAMHFEYSARNPVAAAAHRARRRRRGPRGSCRNPARLTTARPSARRVGRAAVERGLALQDPAPEFLVRRLRRTAPCRTRTTACRRDSAAGTWPHHGRRSSSVSAPSLKMAWRVSRSRRAAAARRDCRPAFRPP